MDGPWQVATASQVGKGSPSRPVGSRDGNRLFFLSGSDMMEVPLDTTTELRIGTPHRLFTFAQAPAGTHDWQPPGFALRADGETFIMVRPIGRPPGIVVVQNWLALIEP